MRSIQSALCIWFIFRLKKTCIWSLQRKLTKFKHISLQPSYSAIGHRKLRDYSFKYVGSECFHDQQKQKMPCFSCDQIWLRAIMVIGGMATPKKWQLLSLWSAEVSARFCKHQKAWKETGPATRTVLDISITPCVNVTRNSLKTNKPRRRSQLSLYKVLVQLSDNNQWCLSFWKSGNWFRLHWTNFNEVLYSFQSLKGIKNSIKINLPVGSLSHSWCFAVSIRAALLLSVPISLLHKLYS